MRLAGLAVAIVLSVAAAGPAEDPARLVIGKWALDVKLSARTQPRYEGATPEQLESLARKIAAAAPDARFEFTGRTYSFGWGGKTVQKGAYLAGVGDKTPGREVIGLTTEPEAGEADIISIQMDGPDVMSVSHADIPYTLALRRVK